MKCPPPPTVNDYPRAFIEDGRPGAERRQTIDGLALSDVPHDAAQPLVSIITVVFNNHRHIERAMKSVFEQSYRNIEYIVIDGGSTDGSVELIQRNSERLSYWHSASDGGISDAFNAGVALARGQFVGLVNSDDWMSTNQVEEGVKALMLSDAPFVFGDLIYHRHTLTVHRIRGDPRYSAKLRWGMPQFTHPTTLTRRAIYERYGLFRPSLRIAMDYDWLFRLYQNGIVGNHFSQICGHMSLGGVSDVRWRQCLREQCEIAIAHGGKRILLEALYAMRQAKIVTRQFMEHKLPRTIRWLRPMINRSIVSKRFGS